MKKICKLLSLVLVGTMFLTLCLCLTACGEETPKATPTPANTQSVSTPAPTDEPGDTGNEDEGFSYAGTYTYEEDGIVYEMLVLANTDYEMSVTKDFGTYKAIKYFLGPLKDINENSMAQMPVFLGDFYYEGEGAPSQEDTDALADSLNTLFGNAKSALGEGEEVKFFYVTLDKENGTFQPNVELNGSKGLQTALDYTAGIWTAEEAAAALESAGAGE